MQYKNFIQALKAMLIIAGITLLTFLIANRIVSSILSPKTIEPGKLWTGPMTLDISNWKDIAVTDGLRMRIKIPPTFAVNFVEPESNNKNDKGKYLISGTEGEAQINVEMQVITHQMPSDTWDYCEIIDSQTCEIVTINGVNYYHVTRQEDTLANVVYLFTLTNNHIFMIAGSVNQPDKTALAVRDTIFSTLERN